MYLEPQAYVKIGSSSKYLEFFSVNKIEIDKSVKELGNKAIVTLPRNYALLDGKSILDVLKTGMPVEIKLGDENGIETEFKGFVQEIESNIPLVIHCDDDFYPYKRNTLAKKTMVKATLRQVLTYAFPKLKIECPDVDLGTMIIGKVSSYKVLKELHDTRGFYSRLEDGVLKCLWPYKTNQAVSTKIHTYTFYTPTVKKSDLKYKRAEDVKIKVRVSSKDKKGKKVKWETGSIESDASLHAEEIPGLTEAQCKEEAETILKRLAFDGFTGTITGFGNPRTQAGDSLKIVNPLEPDQEGVYLIDTLKINYDPFSASGYERVNTLSYKLR